jgi:hypothetical protein
MLWAQTDAVADRAINRAALEYPRPCSTPLEASRYTEIAAMILLTALSMSEVAAQSDTAIAEGSMSRPRGKTYAMFSQRPGYSIASSSTSNASAAPPGIEPEP